MNDLSHHIQHLINFDGLLHWCFLLFAAAFPIGLMWVFVRVLIPLRQLARQAESLVEGQMPAFHVSVWSIHEVLCLKQSLQQMIEQIQQAQHRESVYRAALTESQENERRRIARDIHDDIIQSLVVVGHEMERAAVLSGTAAAPHLERARQQLVQTIDGLRQMIADLRPTLLDELGLVVALETLCEAYAEVQLVVSGTPRSLHHAHELALFRTAQEAIFNALRHAQPQAITLELRYSDAEVCLDVRDDGLGFSPPAHLGAFALHGHYGLIGIRERIQSLGGIFSLISQPAQGTHLSVSLPADQAAHRAAIST